MTPFSVSEQWRQLDWMSALNLWENLSPSMQRVGELVGVEERFIVRAIRGNINTNSSAQVCFHLLFITNLLLFFITI